MTPSSPDPLREALNDVVTKSTWRPDNTVLIHDGTAWNTLVGRIAMATNGVADEGLRELIAETGKWLAARGDDESLIVAQHLEAALAAQPTPAPGLDVERLGTAMSEAWPADEQLVDDSEVWHRFAPLVVTEYVRLERTPR